MTVLYVASNQPRTGKTAVCVALAQRLSQEGRRVALFKPFFLSKRGEETDDDGRILRQAVKTGEEETGRWPIALSDGEARQSPTLDGAVDAFRSMSAKAEVTIVEGISGLGGPWGTFSQQLAEALDAVAAVVVGHASGHEVDEALEAKRLFGERLVGVVINGVTRYGGQEIRGHLIPRLESEGVKVLCALAEDRRLLGVTVGQLAQHLGGRFLNGEAGSDGLVEHVLIGGLMLDWGVPYFERFPNKAVIVRGDRPDIQMAALATPTSCLVLTGGHPPIQHVRNEAERAGVPLIQVEGDTLSTATALESLHEKALFDHPLKRERFLELLSREGGWEALSQALGF